MVDCDLTAQRLRELFSYNADDGVFTRLTQRGPSKPGPVKPCLDSHGYQILRVDYRLHRLHRLAWLHVHGEHPKGDIDHINGDRADNRLRNLRDVTRSENCQNLRGAQSHSKLGTLGVSAVHNSSRFRARIFVNGAEKYLGCFDSEQEAHDAYLQAKREIHPAGTI